MNRLGKKCLLSHNSSGKSGKVSNSQAPQIASIVIIVK